VYPAAQKRAFHMEELAVLKSIVCWTKRQIYAGYFTNLSYIQEKNIYCPLGRALTETFCGVVWNMNCRVLWKPFLSKYEHECTYLQHDKVPPHISRYTRHYLNQHFVISECRQGSKWNGHRGHRITIPLIPYWGGEGYKEDLVQDLRFPQLRLWWILSFGKLAV
jgi:hypothetical protein